MNACKSIDFFALGSGVSRPAKSSTVISCRGSPRPETRTGKTNYYKILSLESENVGFEDIKNAHRSMALQYHPDVCPPSTREECTGMFVDLHRAYQTLSNPELRRECDSELRLRSSEGDFAQPGFSRERLGSFSFKSRPNARNFAREQRQGFRG